MIETFDARGNISKIFGVMYKVVIRIGMFMARI